jgi:hypothetical protein
LFDHFYIPLGTTSNYSAIAGLRTSHAKSSSARSVSNSRSQATAPDSDFSTFRPRVLSSQVPTHNSCQLRTTAPSLLSLPYRTQLFASNSPAHIYRHRPRREHPVSTVSLPRILACVSVFVGTCLQSRCLGTVFVHSPIA